MNTFRMISRVEFKPNVTGFFNSDLLQRVINQNLPFITNRRKIIFLFIHQAPTFTKRSH